MRKTINLNFNWYFYNDFKDSFLIEYKNINGFSLINVPHNAVDIPFNNFDERKQEIVSCYKKIINIKKEYEGKIIELNFDGVAHKATIYVNDNFVVIHRGGYSSFKVDISEFVSFGEDNIVTVLVDATINNTIPPFGSFIDYMTYGGIYRNVSLEVSDKDKIVDFFIRTPNASNNITAYCDIEVNNTPVEIVLTVLDDNEQVSVYKYNVNREKETLNFDVKNKVNWSCDNPKLYKINLKMYSDKKLLDEVNGKFGFRDVIINKSGFYLNGELIKLVGLNRHQSYPYVGYAMPKRAQEKDAEILKYELGCNIVRTSHYMQSPYFLSRCDEIGLLVMEEIPGWQYIGGEDFKNSSYENVKDMILRDRFHPSIVMWGVRINESMDNHDFYKKTNEIAHFFDETRPTFGVRNFIQSELLEDVYTFNDFVHEGKKDIITKVQKTPHMITEHNGHMYPTKRYDDEAHRIEQATRHLKVVNSVLGSENIIGVTGWCMSDYNTNKDFGSGDKVCYHGVLDMFRIPKYAGHAYASQTDDKVILEIASSLARGDYAKSEMKSINIYTNCEYVKMFKNDDYVGTYYPDHNIFPYLKHPPIIIKDMIGQILERKEKMSFKDSECLKKIMRKAIENGYKLDLLSKIKCFFIMKKNKRPVTDVYDLFIKYVVGKANEDFTYRFDGYSNENVVKSVTIKDVKTTKLLVLPDNIQLHIGDTYDVTRVVLKDIDQDGNLVPYSFKPVDIEVTGGLDIIGPNKINLQGGALAFWVKTNQTSNFGEIKVKSIDQEEIIKIEIL